MSHIAKIELEINDLDALKAASKALGAEFVRDQKNFKWYGAAQSCDHVIRFPDAQYEIGVVKMGNQYALYWDEWRQGGLLEKIGKNAGKLKQAYTVERVRREARRKGYSIQEQRVGQGIRLVMTV